MMITVYEVKENGFYGGSKEINPQDGVGPNWVYDKPPTLICQWINCEWVPQESEPKYEGLGVNVGLAETNSQIAKDILSATDWTAIPSVADPLQSNPYLTNQQSWIEYRSAIRNIAINTPETPIEWPEQPPELWSN